MMSEKRDSRWYVAIRAFTAMVKKTSVLTWQQKQTLCGQAMHGDLAGARQGYERMMRGEGYNGRHQQRQL